MFSDSKNKLDLFKSNPTRSLWTLSVPMMLGMSVQAIYMLIALKLDQSYIKKTQELLENFKIICNKLCDKSKELEEKFKRLEPDNVSN